MGIKDWLLDKKFKQLIKGLESSSLEVQKKSALGLLEIKDQIMDELVESYDKLRGTGKKNLMVVLGKTYDERAVKLLIKALKGSDALVRDKAVESLVALGKELVAHHLLAAMKEGNRGFYNEALKVLNNMDLSDISKGEKIYYFIAKDEYHECIDIGSPAVEPLLQALEEYKEDSDRKRSIVIALGKLGDSRALPQLIGLLKDQDKYVRERTVEALRLIGDRKAVPPLIDMLEDGNAWVRKAVVKALDELCWVPEDKYTEARYQLAKKNYKKCIEIGKPSVNLMIDILQNAEDQDIETIEELIKALGKIGDVKCTGVLISYLKDDNNNIRNAAIRALTDLGPVASSFILKELNESKDEKTKDALVGILGEIGDEQSAVTLLELLPREKASIKASIAAALGKIKCRDAVEPLLHILRDKSGGRQVVENAIVALGEIGDDRAVVPLIELMKEGQYLMGKVKNIIARALGKIGDERAVDTLIDNIQDRNCSLSCIDSLGIIASPESAEALYLIMVGEIDGTMDCRLAAVRSLEKIGGEEIQAILYASLEEIKDEKVKKEVVKSLTNLGVDVTGKQSGKFRRKLGG
ncbi:MAG: Phycocyanobilin lyase subunit alpha [bacterium ADurb.Bin363]|nr:MAG: Phycocyanobilin lyase subunit alpha [bacterium ADurb.Bin363]